MDDIREYNFISYNYMLSFLNHECDMYDQRESKCLHKSANFKRIFND